MDFSPTAREIEFLGTAKRLMEGRVYPLEAKLLESKSFRAVLPELERVRDEVVQRPTEALREPRE